MIWSRTFEAKQQKPIERRTLGWYSNIWLDRLISTNPKKADALYAGAIAPVRRDGPALRSPSPSLSKGPMRPASRALEQNSKRRFARNQPGEAISTLDLAERICHLRLMDSTNDTTDALRHTRLEDLQGLSIGVFFCALGLQFLTHLGFLTGQTAGMAVIIAYLTGWSFGSVFFVVNLPFYWIAYTRMGLDFTVRSLACVTALSVLSEWLPGHLLLAEVSPALGMVIFGTLVGAGLLILFRHKGSLGGLGVTALLIQDKFGFRAGYVQLLFDAALFTIAAFLFPAQVVLYSLLGAIVLNFVIAFNHRRDRYIAT